MESTVRVRVFGSLRKSRPPNADSFPLTEGATIASLIAELGIPEENVNFVFRNGSKVEMSTPVRSGDVVGLFPALGGG